MLLLDINFNCRNNMRQQRLDFSDNLLNSVTILI